MNSDTLGIVVALLATGVLIAFNALYVFHEFSFVVIRPVQARKLAKLPTRGAQLVSKGIKHLDHYIAVDQLGITVTSIAVGWIGQPVVADLFSDAFGGVGLSSGGMRVISVTLAFIVLTAVQMSFGELMPKTVALRHPIRVAQLVAAPVEITARILHPLVWLLNGLGGLTVRMLGLDPQTESHSHVLPAEELTSVIEMSAREGVVEIDPATMRRALNFSDLRASDILVSRQDVTAINAAWPAEQVLDLARSTRYTRFPVYEGSIDRVTGMLNLKDLVQLQPDGEFGIVSPWQDAVHAIPTLPEHAPIEQVLYRLGEDQQQMALVVDEFGGTSGILTVADITSWLVGDSQEIVASGDGAYGLPGKTSLATVETTLGISFGSDELEQDSVGGLIMAQLQRVPTVGDTVTIEGHQLEVAAMKGPRVTQVVLRPRQRGSDHDPDHSGDEQPAQD